MLQLRSNLLALIVLLITVLPAGAVDKPSSLARDDAWITNLKCGDLLIDEKTPNFEKLPIFNMWVRGFLAGVSAIGPVNLTEKVKTGSLVSMVLLYCSTHRDDSAVETAIDATQLALNTLNVRAKKVIELKSPGVPAAE